MTEGHTPTKCSYYWELKVVLTTVPTASKLLIKFSINVLTPTACKNLSMRLAFGTLLASTSPCSLATCLVVALSHLHTRNQLLNFD